MTQAEPTAARLVLVDTEALLPGLLPLHAWSALMSSDLVLVRSEDHPFLDHLRVAELRVEVVPEDLGEAALTRADLLSGLSGSDRRRAEHIVERVRDVGEAVYLVGPHDDEGFTRTLALEAARAQLEVEVVYLTGVPRGIKLLDLVAVQERLLAPDGCPWDREQTHESLAPYATEEVFELLDAIAEGDPAAIREELGDVLLQVTFHAQLAAAAGQFDIDDVAAGIAAKLRHRHPHVFGSTEVADADEVIANWEQLKAAEKPERTGPFDGVPRGLPALAYAAKLQARAAKRGLDASSSQEAVAALRDAAAAVTAAPDDAAAIGALLLTVVAVAHHAGADPESALRAAVVRYRRGLEAPPP